MTALQDALPAARRGAHAETADALAPQVSAALGDGDTVLVKGSAGAKTGRIVAAIKALDGSNGNGGEAGHAA
jgi:UDP-N-acetylmuramoyl-tripeptide--D-alanyl-D-alanine ligase